MGEIIKFPVSDTTVALNEAKAMFDEAAELMKNRDCSSSSDLPAIIRANQLYVEATNRIIEAAEKEGLV